MHRGDTPRRMVAALLDAARAGRGGALLVRAAPGLGVSSLLADAASGFTDGTVLRARGVTAESVVPYSGLHALLEPVVDQVPPGPLAQALELAAPPAGGSGPVLSGVLGLLRRLAERGRPVLCCADDAHRFDPASQEVLGFVARRLGNEAPGRASGSPAESPAVAMLIGLPADESGAPWSDGVAAVALRRLPEPEAAALADQLLPPDTDPSVREAVLWESDGNPGLLTDIVRHLRPAQLAGTEPVPCPLPAAGDRQREVLARLGRLPADSQTLLLLAAAAQELCGHAADTTLVLRAVERAGLGAGALAPVERAGIAAPEAGTLRFAHPLLHRVAYWGPPPHRRRQAHRWLADVLDERRHPLLWLRCRAAAIPASDPALAAALATAAGRVRPVTARRHRELADALIRAAGLGGSPGARVRYLTAAAEHTWSAGRPHRARVLLDEARELPAGDAERGRTELLRGWLELRTGIVTDARAVLLEAARLLMPHAPGAARDALFSAADAAWGAGDTEDCRAILGRVSACPEPGPPGLLGLYATGMAAVLRGRFDLAGPPLRGCIVLAAREHAPERLLRAVDAALVFGEVTAARDLGCRALAAARTSGSTILVPVALERLAYSELRTGAHGRAAAHARAGLVLAYRTGQRDCAAHHHAVLSMAAAIEGDATACAEHAQAAGQDAGPYGLGMAATLAQWSLARCDLGRGRPHAAAHRLRPLVGAVEGQGHFALRMLAIPCFVEAAALSGAPQTARAALDDFVHWTEATTDPRARAQLVRCRALLAGPQAAAQLFAQAMGEHTLAEGDYERGRTQLLHGMALRRQRRPGTARGVLRDALLAFERCGARAWAEQARAELRASGEPAGPPRSAALAELTPQQLRIARCVAEGATNREVAARLSVSPRTVDHHLRNVFTTLGIRSRVELARFLTLAGEKHLDGGGRRWLG